MAKLSDGEKLELANWAKELQENKNFDRLINGLVAETIAKLMSVAVGSDAAVAAHAELMGINAVKAALTVLINDGAVIRDKAR